MGKGELWGPQGDHLGNIGPGPTGGLPGLGDDIPGLPAGKMWDSSGNYAGNIGDGPEPQFGSGWQPPEGGCRYWLGLLAGCLMLIVVALILFAVAINYVVQGVDQASGGALTRVNQMQSSFEDANTMRVQALFTGSDWLKPSYRKEAVELSVDEVNSYMKTYKGLTLLPGQEVRNAIVVMKHHPGWEPYYDPGGVIFYSKWGTVNYRFRVGDKYKDVPFLVPKY